MLNKTFRLAFQASCNSFLLALWPVGSTQWSGACTGRRAAERGSQRGRSWCTRCPTEPAGRERSCPKGRCESGCPAADSEAPIYNYVFCILSPGKLLWAVSLARWRWRWRGTYHPMSSWQKLFKVVETWGGEDIWQKMTYLSPIC